MDLHLATQPQASGPLAFTTSWHVVVAAYLDAALDSPHTRRAYARHLQDAFAALSVATVAELTGAQLAAYRAQLTGNNLAPASQGQALAALRSFLGWSRTMGAHRLPAEVIAAALRTPRPTVRKPYHVLAEPEIAAVLKAAATARDRALLAVLLGAGLRAAEAVGLDVGDVLPDQEGGVALHVQGKGRKERIVPIQGDVLRLLRAYLAATGRTLGSEGPLFRAHDRAASSRANARAQQKLPRHRLTTRAAGYVVNRCTKAAGVDAKRISPHSLRHTFALRSLRQKRDVIAVQKLLGHASVATTQRYLDHLDLAELRAAVPALPLPGDDQGGQELRGDFIKSSPAAGRVRPGERGRGPVQANPPRHRAAAAHSPPHLPSPTSDGASGPAHGARRCARPGVSIMEGALPRAASG